MCVCVLICCCFVFQQKQIGFVEGKSSTSILILKFPGSSIFSFNDSAAIRESVHDANLLNIQHI